MLDNKKNDDKTNLPVDKEYLEYNLPPYLQISLDEMKKVLKQMQEGCTPPYWDDTFCELQSNLNVAEVEGDISSKQAWYLRENYLGIKKETIE